MRRVIYSCDYCNKDEDEKKMNLITINDISLHVCYTCQSESISKLITKAMLIKAATIERLKQNG